LAFIVEGATMTAFRGEKTSTKGDASHASKNPKLSSSKWQRSEEANEYWRETQSRMIVRGNTNKSHCMSHSFGMKQKGGKRYKSPQENMKQECTRLSDDRKEGYRYTAHHHATEHLKFKDEDLSKFCESATAFEMVLSKTSEIKANAGRLLSLTPIGFSDMSNNMLALEGELYSLMAEVDLLDMFKVKKAPGE
jgi:hypothetical protein